MSDALDKALENGAVSYTEHLYIKDSTGAWVDFSSTIGENAVREIGKIASSASFMSGTFDTPGVSVKVANKGFFWYKNPAWLTSLRNITGAAAVFTSWKMSPCKVVRKYLLPAGANDPQDCGHFYLKDITFDVASSSRAQLNLVSKAWPLRQASAKDVRNGKVKYRDRSAAFAIDRMMQGVYADTERAAALTPQQLLFENTIPVMPTDQTERRCISSAGRPPEQLTSNAFVDAEAKGYVCRAMVADGADTTGDRVYMGIDEDLYVYTRSNNKYLRITAGTAAELGTGNFIRRVWYNANDGKIWGAAWSDPEDTPSINVYATGGLYLFDYDGTTFTVQGGASTKHFSGGWCYRPGKAIYTAGGESIYAVGQGSNDIGGLISFDCGENILIPFYQYVHADNHETPGGPTDNNLIGAKGLAGVLVGAEVVYPDDFNTYPYTHGVGYINMVSKDYNTDETIKARHSIGQHGFCEFNSTGNAILYVLTDSTYKPTEFYLYKHDIATNTASKICDFKEPGGGQWVQPLCGCSHISDDKVYIGVVDWKTAGSSIAYILALDISAGTLSTIWDASPGPQNATLTPLEMVYIGGSLVVSLLRRDGFTAGNTARYYMGTHPLTDQDSIDNLTAGSMYQFKGLCYDGGLEVFAVECGTGKAYSYNLATYVLAERDTFNTVGNEQNQVSNIICIEDDTLEEFQFWGVSAPDYPNEFLETPAPGSYRLWKYSKRIFDYLDMIDGEAPSIIKRWEYIEKICSAFEYMPRWRRDGKFQVVNRPITLGTSQYTFTNNDGVIRIKDLKVNFSDVYNKANVIPYGPDYQRDQPKLELAAGHAVDEVDFQLTVSTSTQEPFHIVLVAVGNGRSFKWKSFDSQFQCELSAAEAAGATVINVNLEPSAFSDVTAHATTGDYLVVQDSNGNDNWSMITAYDADAQTFTIAAPGLLEAMAAGDSVTIIKNGSGEWNTDTLFTFTAADTFYQIGSTGVYLKNSSTENFLNGERITLRSTGRALAPLSHCPQYAENVYSRSNVTGGVAVEFPRMDNRCLNVFLAKNKAVYAVKNSTYGLHHWDIVMTGVMQYDLYEGDQVKVQHDVFQGEKQGIVQCQILSMAPQQGKWCEYVLRSILPVNWMTNVAVPPAQEVQQEVLAGEQETRQQVLTGADITEQQIL